MSEVDPDPYLPETAQDRSTLGGRDEPRAGDPTEGGKRGEIGEAPSIAAEYLTDPLDMSWIDEGKETLATRVAQIKTGVHWAEEPLSRVSHLVTNVRIASATPQLVLRVFRKERVYRDVVLFNVPWDVIAQPVSPHMLSGKSEAVAEDPAAW